VSEEEVVFDFSDSELETEAWAKRSDNHLDPVSDEEIAIILSSLNDVVVQDDDAGTSEIANHLRAASTLARSGGDSVLSWIIDTALARTTTL
jgi:hypothetical protein